MTKVAIIGGGEETRAGLKNVLDRYSEKSGEIFSVRSFFDSIEFLDGHRFSFDVVFLDERPSDRYAKEVVALLRQYAPRASIFFLTDIEGLAEIGYTVNPAELLLKPIEYFSFYVKMERVMARRRAR